MKKIYFVTTNDYKFKKFSDSIDIDNIELEKLAEETPEIQAPDNQEISAFSAEWAANKFNLPVIKEDIGLYIDALNGFPGPYLNQIEKWIETDGFIDIMKNRSPRTSHWEYSVSYCEPNQKAVTFYTHQEGSIAPEARGKSGWFADKIFIPANKDRTIAELLDDNEYVRNENHYKQLREYLSQL